MRDVWIDGEGVVIVMTKQFVLTMAMVVAAVVVRGHCLSSFSLFPIFGMQNRSSQPRCAGVFVRLFSMAEQQEVSKENDERRRVSNFRSDSEG